jgi:hypothetical protein
LLAELYAIIGLDLRITLNEAKRVVPLRFLTV